MAAMHTTMIRASMTAYSTAVGPSSSRRNRSAKANKVSFLPLSLFPRRSAVGASRAACEPGFFKPRKEWGRFGPGWRAKTPQPFGGLATH